MEEYVNIEQTFDQHIYDMLYDNPEMILYMKNRYQTAKLWKYCIELDPSIFGQMENPTEDIAEYALNVCGENIIPLLTKFEYIPLTKRLAFIALRTFPGAIMHIPQSILTEEMFDMAFNAQPSLISVMYNMLTDEYLMRRVYSRPSDIRYIKNPTERMKLIAIEREPNTIMYIDNPTPQMLHLLNELKPGMAELYSNTLESENGDHAENTEKNGEAESSQWSNSY